MAHVTSAVMVSIKTVHVRRSLHYNVSDFLTIQTIVFGSNGLSSYILRKYFK